MKKHENEMPFPIRIHDNKDWHPDLEFYVELYDFTGSMAPKFYGDDTRCKVTILDDDFPGSLCFEETQI